MLRRILFSACSVALLTGAMETPGTAQPLDKRTLFRFSAPVSIPGVTLPAGEYLFRLANPDGGRNVIQVFSADGRKPYGMFFSMRAERFEPASKPEVRFMETATGMPTAIRTWWYPGERSGYEFVYPKEQARRLAQGSNEPVLTTQAQTTTTAETNTVNLTHLSASGQETNVGADATPAAAAPGGTTQSGEIASSGLAIANPAIPARTDPAPVSPVGQSARTSLPVTGSLMPVVALVGCLTLFLSMGMWLSRRTRW